MANDNTIGIARDVLLQKWKAKGSPFIMRSAAYWSTATIQFDAVDAFAAPVAPIAGAAATVHLVARPQSLAWFGYGSGANIAIGPNLAKIAAEADTNLGVAGHTNGGEDMAIESMSATAKRLRIEYAAAVGAVADPAVVAAYAGLGAVVDPFGRMIGAEAGGAAANENVLLGAVAPEISLAFVFDKQGGPVLACLDALPEGGAKSQLRAHGEANTSNRYKVPDGKRWMAAGSDSDLSIRGTLANAVVVACQTVQAGGAAAVVVPARVYLDVTIRVHGVAFRALGQN